MKCKKTIVALSIVAVAAISAINVSAFDIKLMAVRENKTTKIFFDGVEKPLYENMHVLNYKDYNYTSARFVAEGLGADVQYDPETNTVNLTSVPPVIHDVYYEDKLAYRKLPLSYIDENVEISVKNLSLVGKPYFEIEFARLADYSYSIDLENTYIEYKNEKKNLLKDENSFLTGSINQGDTNDLYFELFDEKDVDYIKLVMPVKYSSEFMGVDKTLNLVFRIAL